MIWNFFKNLTMIYTPKEKLNISTTKTEDKNDAS